MSNASLLVEAPASAPPIRALGGWPQPQTRVAAANASALRETRLLRSGRRPIGFVGAVVAARRTASDEAGEARGFGHEAALYLTATGGLVARLSAWADPAALSLDAAAPRLRWDDAAPIDGADDARALIARYDAAACAPPPLAALDAGMFSVSDAAMGDDGAEAAAIVAAWERYATACRRLEDDFDGLIARFFGDAFKPPRRRSA